MRRININLLATCLLSATIILTGCKKENKPSVSTSDISAITLNSAMTGGTVSSDGGAEVTARGVCWSTGQQPTTSDNHTSDGMGTGDFTSNVTDLEEGTNYYLRAYATNTEGTSYGNIVTFTTGETATATVVTTAATSIMTTSGITGGNITDDGGLPITARGVAWSTSPVPGIEGDHTSDGTGTGEFTSNLTGLTPGTTYYIRAYATNDRGTAYGNEISFTTSTPGLATLITSAVENPTPTSIVSGGNITGDGGVSVSERGVVWNTSPNPTIDNNRISSGSGTGSFTSNITGLTNGTVYFVRSYAINSVGTAYGNEIKFITPVADVEGNIYKTAQIGNQVWMSENLKTVHYRNNTPIPQVADSLAWIGLSTPAYSWYQNNINYKPMGALYNWFTVATGNLCPQGWHVPSNTEFEAMEAVAGVPVDSIIYWGWRGTGVGTKLKDSIGWFTGTGTNELGFSATGSGYRAWNNSQFRGRDQIAYYWSATDDAVNAKPEVAYYRRLDAVSGFIFKATTEKAGGKSVRCVKDM